ncbi:hypothetical protein AAA799B03_00973 [Marine Group I thaumarchaeote SCGC AAA799-B03]|uniref:Uncharacterized protein n=3 Tax=Marine Group I TaxID=905826 RepID=A0A087S6X0_9ARCH|nr:hypothetical protein AAA799N04_00830 [Marine Group I thaumarchaeote SCGC AAA799-N04]KFM19206.1 hypothetical protein SCCGRSA3_00791 [Marine Group I thaumarchaeote SCGC RSA3]KFM21474.1 hypothetical protein AAA799B03_00973 [Marine Group I thaumarchaeote SCGC AAA799-B03]
MENLYNFEKIEKTSLKILEKISEKTDVQNFSNMNKEFNLNRTTLYKHIPDLKDCFLIEHVENEKYITYKQQRYRVTKFGHFININNLVNQRETDSLDSQLELFSNIIPLLSNYWKSFNSFYFLRNKCLYLAIKHIDIKIIKNFEDKNEILQITMSFVSDYILNTISLNKYTIFSESNIKKIEKEIFDAILYLFFYNIFKITEFLLGELKIIKHFNDSKIIKHLEKIENTYDYVLIPNNKKQKIEIKIKNYIKEIEKIQKIINLKIKNDDELKNNILKPVIQEINNKSKKIPKSLKNALQ